MESDFNFFIEEIYEEIKSSIPWSKETLGFQAKSSFKGAIFALLSIISLGFKLREPKLSLVDELVFFFIN